MFDRLEKKFVFYTFLTIVFCTLIVKLFQLQIYEQSKYFQYSEKNRIKRQILQPRRGLIYDRFGKVIVENGPAYSLNAIPYECSQDEHVLNKLSEIAAIPVSKLKEKLRQSESPFSAVKLLRDVDYNLMVKVEERKLELPGIFFDVEARRHYAAGINGAHIFGYLGEVSRSELERRQKETLRQGDIVGKKGLERYYDHQLRGQVGYNYVEVDVFGKEVDDLSVAGEKDPIPGSDFYLTLDIRLQKLAEDLFEEKKGGLVLFDVHDGGVLTLCSKPDYDLNLFSGRISGDNWRNLISSPDKPLYDRMIQSEFPPGSTFKLVLVAAALETGKIKEKTIHTCYGSFRFGRRNFNCWFQDGHGAINLLEAIKYSCNVYFYQTILKTGLEPWVEYARKFGFGQKTNIDLLGESSGLVPDRTYFDRVYGKNGWTRGALVNLAIGQGDLLVTPLQMAQFAMMLANKGVYYQPHLLHKMSDFSENKTTFYQHVEKNVQGVLPETFDVIRQGMYQVVHGTGGTGRASAIPNIYSAGKTGTAQNPYGDAHAWFIGFAPFEQPQVAICVFIENGGGGGAKAAPIAGKLLRRYFADQQKTTMYAKN